MARKNPSHRFGVICQGVKRELLSVVEKPSGDLVVVPSHPLNIEIDNNDVPVLSERFSIHRSLNSRPKGSTVKLTRTLEGNVVEEICQFRLAGPLGFMTLIYGSMFPDINNERYVMRPRNRDEVSLIYDFDMRDETIFVFVIACDFEPNIAKLTKSGLWITIQQFDSFWLVLASGFIHAAPSPYGLNSTVATSTPKVNGLIPSNARLAGSIGSVDENGMAEVLGTLAMGFVSSLKQRLEGLIQKEAGEVLQDPMWHALLSGYSYLTMDEMVAVYRDQGAKRALLPHTAIGNARVCLDL